MKRIRFSLRALFVIITLTSMVLAWVAYQRHWINERKRLRAWTLTQRVDYLYPDGEPTQPSWVLRLAGEPGLPGAYIRLQGGSDGKIRDKDKKSLEEFKRAFPECEVTVEVGKWK